MRRGRLAVQAKNVGVPKRRARREKEKGGLGSDLNDMATQRRGMQRKNHGGGRKRGSTVTSVRKKEDKYKRGIPLLQGVQAGRGWKKKEAKGEKGDAQFE